VCNLELPSSAAHYAHRAGRTGRMGAPGTVLTLVAPGERFVVQRLSKRLAVPILVRRGEGGGGVPELQPPALLCHPPP
jgi:superfamily II DNA/RNA helicase